MELHEVVLKLVGPVQAVGEKREDTRRLANLRAQYRLYGKRWNERTCKIGRAVTLSRGYSGARLRGHVADFFVLDGCRSADFLACYPDAVDAQMACIQIRLEAA